MTPASAEFTPSPNTDSVSELALAMAVGDHSEEDKMDQKSYLQMYGMTKERALSMKEGAIIMHPGPFNRGVEIADEVLDLPQTRIFKQMKNGVFVRQATLKRSLE